jgi:hypothetical protein
MWKTWRMLDMQMYKSFETSERIEGHQFILFLGRGSTRYEPREMRLFMPCINDRGFLAHF